jgi:hypothetical protein
MRLYIINSISCIFAVRHTLGEVNKICKLRQFWCRFDTFCAGHFIHCREYYALRSLLTTFQVFPYDDELGDWSSEKPNMITCRERAQNYTVSQRLVMGLEL